MDLPRRLATVSELMASPKRLTTAFSSSRGMASRELWL